MVNRRASHLILVTKQLVALVAGDFLPVCPRRSLTRFIGTILVFVRIRRCPGSGCPKTLPCVEFERALQNTASLLCSA